MVPKPLMELQDRIVLSLVRSLTGIWDAAVVNIEIDFADEEQTENCLALSFARDNGGWTRSSFSLPYDCYDLFAELRELMKQQDAALWTSCTLELKADGKYRYSFSYERPRRLNGIHDDEAMLKHYSPQTF